MDVSQKTQEIKRLRMQLEDAEFAAANSDKDISALRQNIKNLQEIFKHVKEEKHALEDDLDEAQKKKRGGAEVAARPPDCAGGGQRAGTQRPSNERTTGSGRVQTGTVGISVGRGSHAPTISRKRRRGAVLPNIHMQCNFWTVGGGQSKHESRRISYGNPD